MGDRLVKKGLVVGIIFLFIGTNFVSGLNIQLKNTTISKNSCLGNTLYVGGSGPGNYTYIQDAINDAVDGDTVFVYNDSSPYYEILVINSSINLIGEDKNTTVIDGHYNGTVVSILANKVNITGFTIQNGEKYDGIYVYSDYNKISNNIIISNKYFGISLRTAHYNVVEDNIIINNPYVGIVSDKDSSFNIIKHNIITNHTSEMSSIGIIVCSNNVVFGNIISSNDYGISLDDIGNNIVIKNTIIDNKIRGLTISSSIRNLILQNNFINNKEDASFTIHKLYHKNIFFNNYWNKPLIGPKIINGFVMFWRFNDWVTYDWTYIDWHPAQKPYDIGV